MPTVRQDDPVATVSSTRGFSVYRLAGDRVCAIATTAGARRMAMIDVYAVEGTFADKHALARDLAEAARAENAQHTQSRTSS